MLKNFRVSNFRHLLYQR